MNSVKIGGKIVGRGHPCLISLEPGATYHNFDEAVSLMEESAKAGADAIKFQTFLPGDADRMMGKKDIMITFGTAKGEKTERVYDALKRRELTLEQWKQLIKKSKELQILFITAPYFPETVDFLVEMNVDAIKVSKGDVNNVLLIQKIAKTGLPIILDAREKLDDIDKAIQICKKENNEKIIIMHCPSGYPAKDSGIHLNALKTIQERYSYPVGFADHSKGDSMNYAAVALGTNMLEKTVTTNKNLEQVEHYMSLEPSEFAQFIKNIRGIEESLGDPDILLKSRVEESARRSLVSKTRIKKGEKISLQMLDYRRPGDAGISVAEGFKLIDMKAKNDLEEGIFLQWNMFEKDVK